VETAETTPETRDETAARASPPIDLAPIEKDASVLVEPDLDFIRTLIGRCGDSFRKCMQCGTCSGNCAISPDTAPFPRKEVAWAVWGLKDRLMQDPDIWLCYQCEDCSSLCPRGARPGDVLAAIRRENIIHYSKPRFLARWVDSARYIPLMLALPILLLGLAVRFREPLGQALGFATEAPDRIVYSYSSWFPHWLLNSFFLFFLVLVAIVAVVGVTRYWRALNAGHLARGGGPPVKSVRASIGAALRSIFTHDNFGTCEEKRSRHLSHVCVFFGFLALTAVTTWVITNGINPLIRGDFVYPFNFWSPWKVLANLGGAAILLGVVVIMVDRIRDAETGIPPTFYDWSLVAALLTVTLSGFLTELLHYMRLEPHRHYAYFGHLVCVFALLVYLPYSKFAHVVYRTTALVFAERIGRRGA